MKNCFKLAVLALFAIILLSVSVFAETTVDMPKEWVDEYSREFPNSEIAILEKFDDIPDDWSRDALIKAVQNGLLNGTDNHILPNDSLTRAQLATIMVRAFGAYKTASNISDFTDLDPDAWYYNEISKAVKMGVLSGDDTKKMRPNDPVTRQEAFTVLSRAFNISGADQSVLSDFNDAQSVASWAKDATASLVEQGYVGGHNGYINPLSYITRAEFAQVMKKLVTVYITEPGVYSQPINGNVMIRVPGVYFENISFDANIYVGEGIESSITFSGVSCSNKLVIRSGENVSISGNFNVVSVIGDNITVNAKEAVIENAFVEGKISKIITATKTITSSDNKLIDQDGDGWTDGWV